MRHRLTTICYYVSDCGYEHAARSLAIIRSMLSQADRQVRLIVCSARLLPFLVQSLAGHEGAVEFHRTSSDLGSVIQEGAAQADRTRFRVEYSKYMRLFPYFIDMEYRFLRQARIDLIVSDISPIPFAAAKLIRVPSVGISNYTWYTAYKSLLEQSWLEPLYRAYEQMDYFIGLPGAKEPLWGKKEHLQTGLNLRQITNYLFELPGMNREIAFAVEREESLFHSEFPKGESC